ncbi:unnamed protein product [Paramecium sonneborni]|uniref:Uncharacterized protein n=1 Tax=Paramecium sonneborni TaxID=65129 RepID=A0A8S1N537_9CILI|nr:unnamed protein product [Paramecium sonneborni]
MSQSISQQICQFLKSDQTYQHIKPFLEKISEKDRQYYKPICQSILTIFDQKDPVQCFLAARMAKEAVERKNNEFLTIFQDDCIKKYEQLAEIIQNQKDSQNSNQFFQNNERSPFGISFFHLVLESIKNWAIQFPKKDDGITPTKFYQAFHYLEEKGISFPSTFYFKTKEQSAAQASAPKQNEQNIIQDLQQQLKITEEQHEMQIKIYQLENQSKLQNLEEQVKYYKNLHLQQQEEIKFQKYKEVSNNNIQDELLQVKKQLRSLEEKERNYLQSLNDLKYQFQQLKQENQSLKRYQESLLEKIKNQETLLDKVKNSENTKQVKIENFSNQVQELQKNYMNLENQFKIKQKESEDYQTKYLEQKQKLNQLNLQLTAKEKLIPEKNVSKDNSIQQFEQQISNYQQKIQQLEGKIMSLEEEKVKLQKQQKEAKKTQSSDNQKINIQVVKRQNSVQFQNFFSYEQQQNNQYFNSYYNFEEDLKQLQFKPQILEVEKIDSALYYPYPSAETYYINRPIKSNKGKIISDQIQTNSWKNLESQKKMIFLLYHVNRTQIIFKDQPFINVAILKSAQYLENGIKIIFGIYIKSELQEINIQGKFLNLNKMSNYFHTSIPELNLTLQRQNQKIIEYSINNNCTQLTDTPILELSYNGKAQKIYLPILLFSFIELCQIKKEFYKKNWKEYFILRSNAFQYNPQVLPSYRGIQQISKSFTMINENKLIPYLQGIDEIKFVAQFVFLISQLKGMIKFELIPQKKMIIYVGVDKKQQGQSQVLLEKIIMCYQSIFQME